MKQYSNVFTPDECKQIISLAKPNLFRSKLGVDEKTGIARTSRQTWIQKTHYLVLVLFKFVTI